MHTRAQTHKHKHTHTQEESTPTQHYTMVFTIFVLMNLFNQVPSPSPPLSPSLPLSLPPGHDGFHNAHTRRTARSIGYTHSHIHGGFFVFMRLFNYLVCLCARTTWYVCRARVSSKRLSNLFKQPLCSPELLGMFVGKASERTWYVFCSEGSTWYVL